MLWTDHDIATLTSMLRHGAEYATIAKVLRRSTMSVTRKAQKLGLKLSPEHAAANRAKTMSEINRRPEQRARMAKKVRVKPLSWCPEHRVSEYRRLISVQRFSAVEARRIITEDEAVIARRAVRG